MRKHEIESWALSIIDRVRSGAANEDSRVELKREWIPPDRAARRLAAHANSALGEPILWLIGVDQKSRELIQSPNELASWWPLVTSYFDGIAPDVVDLALSVDRKMIVALYFDTERRPFVVKSKPDFLEVPWRDGTRTRSATRNELIRLLSPVVDLPNFEILNANFVAKRIQSDPKSIWQLTASLTIYVFPKNDGRLVFPFHRTSCTVQIDPNAITFPYLQLGVLMHPEIVKRGLGSPSATTQASTSELIVTGPGSFTLRAQIATEQLPVMPDRAVVKVSITPAGSEATAVLELPLRKQSVTSGDEIEYR
jgi:hypothetical protein